MNIEIPMPPNLDDNIEENEITNVNAGNNGNNEGNDIDYSTNPANINNNSRHFDTPAIKVSPDNIKNIEGSKVSKITVSSQQQSNNKDSKNSEKEESYHSFGTGRIKEIKGDTNQVNQADPSGPVKERINNFNIDLREKELKKEKDELTKISKNFLGRLLSDQNAKLRKEKELEKRFEDQEKRAKNTKNAENEKINEYIYKIQRSFRRFLVKKYDLPDNYFYNELFLRKQYESFKNNYYENISILFPKNENIDLKTKQDTHLTTNDFNVTINMTNNTNINNNNNIKITKNNNPNNINYQYNLPYHHPHESEKIFLFTKIIDIDLMVTK